MDGPCTLGLSHFGMFSPHDERSYVIFSKVWQASTCIEIDMALLVQNRWANNKFNMYLTLDGLVAKFKLKY